MIDELINKMDEDAPANAVAHGGVDMAPNARPRAKGRAKLDKNKYKDDNKKATDVLRRVIMKKMGNNVKENFDNNNVVLRGVIDKLENIEHKLDEKFFGKTKFEVEETKEYKTFKDKYNA